MPTEYSKREYTDHRGYEAVADEERGGAFGSGRLEVRSRIQTRVGAGLIAPPNATGRT